MHSNCIFCKISEGTQEAVKLYEDEEIVIFKDIKPSAKHHYLAIPKQHIKDAKTLTISEKPLLNKLISVGKQILQDNGGDVNDLRIGFHWPPFNSVQHLHLHIISPASEMTMMSNIVFKPGTWWFATVDYVLERISSNKL